MWAAKRGRGRARRSRSTGISRGETVTRVQAAYGLSRGQASPGSRRDVRSGGGVAGLRVLRSCSCLQATDPFVTKYGPFLSQIPRPILRAGKIAIYGAGALTHSRAWKPEHATWRSRLYGLRWSNGTRCPALTVRREVVRSSAQKMVLTHGQRRAYGQVMTAAAAIGGERWCLSLFPSPDLDSGGRGLRPGMCRSRCRKQDLGRRDDWWVVRRCCEGDKYGSTW